jgi:ABC-type branched-subunit amino acid transport system substrate-binding protein
VLLVLVVVVAGCGNDWQDTSPSSNQAAPGVAGEEAAGPQPTTEVDIDVDEFVPIVAPGVSDTEIRVGGVASVTNPVGGRWGESFDGVKAYFDMVNEQGGIHGRQLVLTDERDDQMVNNATEVQRLISSDVFAVLPVAGPLFTGSELLAREGVPTFGWAIGADWEGADRANLFGQAGSFLCIGCPQTPPAWAARASGADKVGILAYGVPQSTECAEGARRSIEEYGAAAGVEVAFMDQALPFGVSDLSVQVSRMKDEGVGFVLTCMDTNGVVTLAREVRRQGLDAAIYQPNGYDHRILEEYGDLLEGSIVRTDFTQFEVDPAPPGLENFLHYMEARGATPSENSMVGWLNADLFVTGLREAGPEFSREKVIAAINSLTDYTADGLLAGVDWTTAHEQVKECAFFSRVEDGEFVPLGEPDQPFICPVVDGDELVNVAPAEAGVVSG